MKNRILIGVLAGVLFMLAGLNNLWAQANLQLDKANSSLIVKGTSSLHDWEMTATEFEGTLTAKMNDSGLETISDAQLKCKAVGITSDNRIMDNKAHDALNAKNKPYITFESASLKKLEVTNASFSGEIVGNLTIAGKTNTVNIPFQGELLSEFEVVVKGSFPVDETDYGMEPPTALMGTLKTGKDITIEYEFRFNNEQQTIMINEK